MDSYPDPLHVESKLRELTGLLAFLYVENAEGHTAADIARCLLELHGELYHDASTARQASIAAGAHITSMLAEAHRILVHDAHLMEQAQAAAVE
jgi:fructose-1,6-bisphosphatase